MTSTSVTPRSLSLREIADELDRATRTGVPIGPPSAAHPGFDVDAAYEVQVINVGRAVSRGDVRVGHKIGLTSVAMQKQLGVDQPDFGVLLASMNVPNGSTAAQPLLQPRIEAEIAFLLGADLDSADLSVADVLAATDAVMPALEIIDSRIANWKITLPDTVADNASSARVVTGPAVDADPELLASLADEAVELYVDGELAAEGRGAEVLGDPLEAVAWLARTLHAYGAGIAAGELVLAGAVHASLPLTPGTTLSVRSGRLPELNVDVR